MSFWGVEIKPGKPYTLHRLDGHLGKIQITQATLGTPGTLTKRSVVQCNVGDKSPVLLCALLPDKIEACPLNLLFEEEDEVIFSVLGPRSVHLTGFYCGSGRGEHEDDDSDSYGEDIVETDNEADQSADSVGQDEFDDFIDDGDIEMLPPSKGRKSAVVIEETDDDEKPANRKENRKRLKKKYQVSDSDVDDEEIVVKDHARCKVSNSEDEDIVPISHLIKKIATTGSNGEASCNSEIQFTKESKEGNGSSGPSTLTKMNQDSNVQVNKAEQTSEPPKDSSTPSTHIVQESGVKEKKKKKRSRGEDGSAKTEHMDHDRVELKPKEEQPTALPSKDSSVPSADIALESDVKPKKKNKRDRGAKKKTMDQDCLVVKPEEQPSDKLFEPSKDSSVPSTDIGLENVMPKKKNRRDHGVDGDVKTENMDQDHVEVKPEDVQPTDKLENDVTPKKKHRRNRGEDGDAKTRNMDQDLAGVEPEKEKPTDKTTNSVGHVTNQDNGEVKKKKKKKAQKSAENANDDEDEN